MHASALKTLASLLLSVGQHVALAAAGKYGVVNLGQWIDEPGKGKYYDSMVHVQKGTGFDIKDGKRGGHRFDGHDTGKKWAPYAFTVQNAKQKAKCELLGPGYDDDKGILIQFGTIRDKGEHEGDLIISKCQCWGGDVVDCTSEDGSKLQCDQKTGNEDCRKFIFPIKRRI